MSLSFRLVYGILIFTEGVQLLHPRIKNRQQNVAEKNIFFLFALVRAPGPRKNSL